MRFEVPQWFKYECEERLQRLKEFTNTNPRIVQFRELLNENPRVVWSIALASVFILLLTIIFMLSTGNSRPETKKAKQAWFYDLNTGKLFKADDALTGHVKAPSGPLPNGQPAGVRAYVYTYENEPNENEIIIGYLEKPDPNAPANQSPDTPIMGQGKLIRTLEDNRWISTNSKRGKAILNQVTARDKKGRIPRYYKPQ